MDYSLFAYPKVGFNKKTCTDMRELPLGKTNRSQCIDKKARKVSPDEETCICWVPGCTKRAQKAKHHVLQVWDKVIDHVYNYFRACDDHHPECDEGRISQFKQFQIIAQKYGTTVEEVIKTLSAFSGLFIYIEGESVKIQKPILKKVNRNESKEAVPVKKANAARSKRPSKKKPGRKPGPKKTRRGQPVLPPAKRKSTDGNSK